MTWQPQTFQPDTPDAASLFGANTGPTDFTRALENPPAPQPQPWQPKTFQPLPAAPQQTAQPASNPSLLDKISQSYDARSSDAQKYLNRDATGNPSLGGQLNALGDAAGFVAGDVPSAVISATTPDFIKQPVKEAAQWVGNSQAGQALRQLAQDYPETARAVGSLANLASLFPATAATNIATDTAGSALKDIGSGIEASGQASAQAAKQKFIQNLITPKETSSVLNDQFGRSTEQGLLKQRVVQPTAQEQAIIDTVSQIPGVSKNKSLLANHNIIENAKDSEAQNLIANLQKNDVAIPSETTVDALNDTMEQLKKNPFISGDGETAANRVMQGMLEQVKNNPSTASGLLQARKDFDAWVKSQKGDKAFNPNLDSPVTTAVQQIRQTVNDLVDKHVQPPTPEQMTSMKQNLSSAIDEYGNLKQLETHLRNTVQGTAQFAGQQQGFWRRQTISAAADDAKNLANVKQQISAQEAKIKSAEDAINNAAQVPVDVKKSLATQSNLYRALDNIQTKGGAEGKNVISRGAQKAAKVIPVKGAIAKAAVATGLAGGAALSPALTGSALALYGAQKAIRSPTLRIGLGKTLKTTGNLIK